MNGYSSNRTSRGAVLFHSTQAMMTPVCSTKNRAVPMNRAIVSANRPNASASYRGAARRTPFGWSSRRSARSTIDVPFPPVLRQEMVEHIVDGDRADQAVVLVDHRGRHQVVGRQVASHLGELGLRS